MSGIFSKLMDFIGLEECSPIPPKPMVVSQGPQFYHRKCGMSQNSILITQGTTGSIKVFEFLENLETGDSGFKEHNGCPMCKEFVYEHKATSKSEDVEKDLPKIDDVEDSEGVSRGNWYNADEETTSEGSEASEMEWVSEDETQWEESDSEGESKEDSGEDSEDNDVNTPKFIIGDPHAYVKAVNAFFTGIHGFQGPPESSRETKKAPEDVQKLYVDSEGVAGQEEGAVTIQKADTVGDFRRFADKVHAENQRRTLELAAIFE